MNTFIGLSGTIYASGGMAVVITNLQADVDDASVTDVGVVVSGVGTSTVYDFNGITPIQYDMIFPDNTNVYVSSSGSLRNVIINYIYSGDPRAAKFYESAISYSETEIASGYYGLINDGRSGDGQRKWQDVVQSGSYGPVSGGFGG